MARSGVGTMLPPKLAVIRIRWLTSSSLVKDFYEQKRASNNY